MTCILADLMKHEAVPADSYDQVKLDFDALTDEQLLRVGSRLRPLQSSRRRPRASPSRPRASAAKRAGSVDLDVRPTLAVKHLVISSQEDSRRAAEISCRTQVAEARALSARRSTLITGVGRWILARGSTRRR
jgi:hypothetical protein